MSKELPKISQLQTQIADCLVLDQHALRTQLRKLKHAKNLQENIDSKLLSLNKKVQLSLDKVLMKKSALPKISYPENLPVSQKVADISEAIAKHQVVIVAGETGSGKTTQIPKICLALGRGQKGLIGHTQPRRLAARSVSSRIAEELNVQAGQEVGYQVRFKDNTTDKTYIKLMTDGILLAETQHDPFLNKYDTIIIDEAHERSLNIDFLLGYFKGLLPKRPDLKIIITSATIDLNKFSQHFSNAPVIEVSGRTYPVDILYRPAYENNDEMDLSQSVIEAILEIQTLDRKKPMPHKDILVFLSGEKEIRDVANAIRKESLPHLEVLPLYSRLSNKEQDRVFRSHPGRRVVLATNVAETSLTVPGIAYVIDPGKARISRYSVRSKVQRLPVEAISQASANQRSGRCGRLCPGTCIRLYSEDDFLSRPDFTDTEITRTNLASVILQMLSLRLGDIDDFPFVDKPDSRAISDGLKLLEELEAVNGRGELTQKGRLMAKLPVDPKLGRMILESDKRSSLHEILIIVSGLSIQDPRERPMDKQQAADEKHRAFRHLESDFMSLVQLWDFFEEQRQELTQNQLRKFCLKHFLSFMRMREWREVHRQLHLVCQNLKLKENQSPATYEQIHESLLSGLLSQVANRQEDGAYLGARNRKFQIFPGSVLFKKKTKWLLAAELVETTQLYARVNAKIEPEWIEAQGGNLLKHHYFEPHWEKRKGRVMAFEKVSLYGLVLVEKRKLAFSQVDPCSSREIFIREALVAMQLHTKVKFYHYNKALIEKIEQIEDKTRRRDILIDEEQLFQFYDALLPEFVFDAASLDKWVRSLNESEARPLLLHERDLISETASDFDLEQFPDHINTHNMSLGLEYEFNPGQSQDGISVNVPISALKQLKEEDLDWLVPGMLREKCIALVKALPKGLRKNFVPVPDYIDRILPELKQGEGNLKQVLSKHLLRLSGVDIPMSNWENYQVEDHLKMNINVQSENGSLLGTGRNIVALREQFADQVKQSISRYSQSSIEQEGLTEWSFGDLDKVHEVNHGGLAIITYPALVDDGDSVALRLLDNEYRASMQTQAGIVRLYMLKTTQQIKYLKKSLLQSPQKLLSLKMLGSREKLLDQIIRTAYLEAFRLDKAPPRNREDFDALFETGRSVLSETAEKVEELLYRIMEEYQLIQKALKRRKGLSDYLLNTDISGQLENLVYSDFLFKTPWESLKDLPRYLKAINERLEKYPRQQQKDKECLELLKVYWGKYLDKKQFCERQDLSNRKLDEFRWMMEEYRVSVFAQALGTKFPISDKRLQKHWQLID